MRILHISGALSARYGGVAQVVDGLSSAQASLGHDVTVITSMRLHERDELIRPAGAKVVVSLEDKLEKIWAGHSTGLRRDIEESLSGTDIVHVHGIWHYPSFLGSKLAYREEIPYIIAPHGSLDSWCLEYKKTKKKIYMGLVQRKQILGASLVHAITDTEAEVVKMLLPGVRTKTIQNGVDIPQTDIFEDVLAFEKLFPWLANRKIILFMGRIHPKKGIDVLIRAFAEVTRTNVQHVLVIAGPDEVGLKSELQELARELEVEDMVFFTGFVEGETKTRLLSAAEIFVLPSHSEGFSIAILEAMAYTKPVIISTACGFPEVAVENAGIIVRPDSHELAKAMHRVLTSTNLAKEMGANGRRMIERRYSWDRIAEETIEMYNEAITLGPRS